MKKKGLLCLGLPALSAAVLMAVVAGEGGRPAEKPAGPAVRTGLEVLVEEKPDLLKGKRVGLITNPTGIDRRFRDTASLLAGLPGVRLAALFGPEHGFRGGVQGRIDDETGRPGTVPIYSLHGETRRPSARMLEGIDVLVFDIQDIGARSYTYISSLRYVMEEAAAAGIPVIVLDRPNPVNGLIVDGPALDPAFESFIGAVPVPYLHGMTVGELALFMNAEMGINAVLTVVPMKNWHRGMTWPDTGLPWVPTSPHIPEPDTPWFYPLTGILGEASLVNVGVGYTLPFKVLGAPWMDAGKTADALNEENIPGLFFHPIHYQPYYAKFAGVFCGGVRLVITDRARLRPVSAGYRVMAVLRRLYPEEFSFETPEARRRRDMFDKANGTDRVREKIQAGVSGGEITAAFEGDRESFLEKRAGYLLYR